ncbi:hypothetical protein VTL71DRAFT_8503 [Oculimacula yallundae]|uniref:Uncharacterized protein n=1 Tax=Oculimacula yallundae TaxID=86028 RepID=A0ABR4CXU3_9HELO
MCSCIYHLHQSGPLALSLRQKEVLRELEATILQLFGLLILLLIIIRGLSLASYRRCAELGNLTGLFGSLLRSQAIVHYIVIKLQFHQICGRI